MSESGLGADRAKSVLIAAGHTAGESGGAQLLALAAADAGERTMLVELGGAYGSTQVLEPRCRPR
ncbi:MAG: hypothetical protein R2755_28085 [Acidimicrobiales bacterium]